MAKKKKYRYVVQIINRNREVLFEEVNTDFPWQIAHRGNLFFESKNECYDLIKDRIKEVLDVQNNAMYEVERLEMKTVETSASIVFVDEDIKTGNVVVKYSLEPINYFDIYEVYPNTVLKDGKHMLLVKNRESQEERHIEVDDIFDFFFEIFQKREGGKSK